MKNEIRLEKTCDACPEQYDAFIGDKQVGYLRLRHGYFYVSYPDCNDDIIYDSYTKGDGMFTEDERDYFLNQAKNAIYLKLKEEKNE